MSQVKTVLQANSFGWVGQFFQSISHMAPAAAVILSVPFMASRAGSALPLAILFAMVLAMLLAYCLATLSKKYFGASGYFLIHSQALGSKVGFTTSWLFFLYEPLNAFAVMFGFSVFVLEPFTTHYIGFTVPWWAFLIVCNSAVILLSLKKIRSAIGVSAILGLLEFVVILSLGAVLLFKSDNAVRPEFFTPAMSADGMGGLMFAFVFAFLMFVGFESGLPLAEETADTGKSVAKGLMISVFLTGLFYVFLGYASVIGFGGGEDSVNFAKLFSADTEVYAETLTQKAFGTIGPWLIFLAGLNSTIACALASHTATTRVFFSLGRAGILPAKLGQVSPNNKAPVAATLFAGAITFAVGVVFAGLDIFTKYSGVEWFGLLATMLVIPLLIIHLMTCASVYLAYRNCPQHPFSLLHHAVIPAITGALVLLPLWGSVYYNQAMPTAYAPYVVLVWFIIGLFVYAWLRRNKPAALQSLETEMDKLVHN